MHRKVNLYVLSFLLVVFARDGFSQSRLIFPVFVNGPTTPGCTTECRSWMSYASVFNPNDTENTVTFTSYDSNGNIIRSSGQLSVPPFTNLNPAGFPGSGWLKITATKPLIGRETITLLESNSGNPTFGLVRARLNLAAASVSRRHFLNIDTIAPFGVSIVFPSVPENSPARGQLIHRGYDGHTISKKEIVIVPNGQLIGFLADLVPPESLDRLSLSPLGSLEIVFDQDVAVTVLQFWRPTGLIEQEIEEASVGAVEAAR
jgi:hypothetical protein